MLLTMFIPNLGHFVQSPYLIVPSGLYSHKFFDLFCKFLYTIAVAGEACLSRKTVDLFQHLYAIHHLLHSTTKQAARRVNLASVF